MLLHPKKVGNSIQTLASLCSALRIDGADLDAALALPPDERYTPRALEKGGGRIRHVYNPHWLIRRIQRQINEQIFKNPNIIQWPGYVYGSIPNDAQSIPDGIQRDYVSCARRHCLAKSVLTVDIQDFFDNIHRDLVKSIFKDFMYYSEDVSDVLADLCCHQDCVAQGALTSSYLATLCLWSVEGAVVKRLAHKRLTYTRLVDDITISSKVSGYDFSYALAQVEGMVSAVELPLNVEKTRQQYASALPIIVHGLRIDFKEPRLPPEEPAKIRAAVKGLELLAAAPGYRASRSYSKDFNRCMGRVNKLSRVGHSQHKPLLERLRKILPLASHEDVRRIDRLIGKIEDKCANEVGYAKKLWFRKSFYVASERLNVIARSFPKTALDMRARLQEVRPKSWD